MSDVGRREKVARLHYTVDGPTDAPVLVFGPSLGTDLGLFEPQVEALAHDWRVVRHDLRGHGRSQVPDGPYTIGAMADDVLALLDDLGVRRFSYAGVSIGGAIAQWLGVHYGYRLDGLVVAASAARFYDPASWPTRADKVRAEGTEWLVESRYGAWFTREFAQRSPETAEWLLEMLRTTPWEGYAGCCEAIAEFDVRERLADITAPTLVLAGQQDPATPVDTCQAIADGIPGAQLQVVPNTSHLMNVEAPEVVNTAIAEHLGATAR